MRRALTVVFTFLICAGTPVLATTQTVRDTVRPWLTRLTEAARIVFAAFLRFTSWEDIC
ncbi:MAG: hypothetical protein P8Z79_17820 [Sedimentisphaerales bacterium]